MVGQNAFSLQFDRGLSVCESAREDQTLVLLIRRQALPFDNVLFFQDILLGMEYDKMRARKSVRLVQHCITTLGVRFRPKKVMQIIGELPIGI